MDELHFFIGLRIRKEKAEYDKIIQIKYEQKTLWCVWRNRRIF